MSRSRVSRIGLPLSRLSSTARSRECRCTSRASAYRKRARAWGVSPDHRGAAEFAAATAASTSALLPWATRARTAFGAGHPTAVAEVPEAPVVVLFEPLERRRVALRRRSVLHRLEQLGDGCHY